jgi:preprotein translocase subunit SecG
VKYPTFTPESPETSQKRPDAIKTAAGSRAKACAVLKIERIFLMQTLLLFAELVIAVALIGFVLLQRSEGGALGIGGSSGGMGGLFTPRGAADTLTRTTAILAFLFFATCIGLNLLALHGRNETSILDTAPQATPAAPAKPAPAPLPIGPSVPKPQ